MWKIRPEQIESFRQAALASFEDEMAAHSKVFTPKLAKALGEEQLRVALRFAVERAGRYGFTNRGSVRLYIELSFLFGSRFDSDPQYPWAGAFLRDPDDQMQRAERLYRKTLEYQEKVSGRNAANTWEALKALLALARQPRPTSLYGLEAGVLRETGIQEMARAFPQKVAYVCKEGLEALIREASDEARKFQLPAVQGDGLLVLLMFVFGHGCTDDPLYPWIGRTLRNENITSPAGRAERLEQQALAWLEEVVASFTEGVPQ
jgi:hypothetical protein